MTTNPVVLAYPSNSDTQYSPAPVTKIRPAKNEIPQMTPAERKQESINPCAQPFQAIIHNLLQHYCPQLSSPVRISFRMWLKYEVSKTVETTPSMVPIWDPIPSASNIMKKMIDQNGEIGSSTMACVKTTKANPVPAAASSSSRSRLQFLNSDVQFVPVFLRRNPL